MITELELIGSGFAAGEQYVLRQHKPACDSTNVFDFVVPYSASLTWTGFVYRDDEASVLLEIKEGQVT
jgi:hypothetical protein